MDGGERLTQDAVTADVPPLPTPGRARGRLPAAVADQAMAAASNFLLGIVAARWLSTTDFGSFGLLYAVYLIVVGAVRALAAEPALVRAGPARWRQETVGAGLLLALVASAGLALGSLAVGTDLRAPVLVLALVLPGLIVQDMGRYVAFAGHRPGRALRLDALWAVVQVALLLVVAAVAPRSTVTVLLAWGVAGGVSGAAFLALDLRELPRPSTAWVRASWGFSWRYLTTFATTAGVTYLSAVLLGTVAGVEAVGAVRAAQTVFGPLNILYAGMVVVLVPEGAGDQWATDRYRRRLLTISGTLVVVAGAVTTVGLHVPAGAGEALFGATWANARSVLLPFGIVAGFGSLVAGAEIGLRAARAVRESLRVQLALAPLALLAPIVGGAQAGASGFAWGMAASMGCATVLWWAMLTVLLRRGHPASDHP